MAVPTAGLLEGSRALVTGAGRGIGRGIAQELARARADIVLVSRTPGDLMEAAAEVEALGRTATVVTVDIRSKTEFERALAVTRSNAPPIDILVNNAGVLAFNKFWEYDEGTYRAIVDTNLTGTFIVSQSVALYWREQGIAGRIVNIASVESEVAYPDQAPYAATKGGILTMTKVLARELGVYGIRVNAIGPGPIDTPLSQQFRQLSEAKVVFGRLGLPSEVGHAVVFLASSMSTFVTGTILYVDGGYTLK
jgi:NAD(P)-dependent dehydrogenase (short-subunit alcohol dehydrogenase family)